LPAEPFDKSRPTDGIVILNNWNGTSSASPPLRLAGKFDPSTDGLPGEQSPDRKRDFLILKVWGAMFFVYALYSKKYDKIYIGQTCDLKNRLIEHNLGLSFYTKRYLPWEIIYTEECFSRSEALKREKQLKSQKGREFVWNIIKAKNSADL